MKLRISFSLVSLLFVASYAPKVHAADIVIDTVLASVDGKPITLRDVQKRLRTKKAISASDAVKDPEVKYALDSLIVERMILEEAESRKMNVSDAESNSYVDEVAKQNGLTRAEFEQALTKEGRTLTDYKAQVKIEILKSRIASASLMGGVGISEDEIDRYLTESSGNTKSEKQVTLKQIVISKTGRSQEDYQALVAKVKEGLAKGDSFSSLVEQFSDGSEKSDGGAIGTVSESDLSQEIFDATLSLKEGEVSRPVESADGTRFFLVDKINTNKAKEQKDPATLAALRDDARKILQRRKLETKMQSFFSTELAKLHSIDRKI